MNHSNHFYNSYIITSYRLEPSAGTCPESFYWGWQYGPQPLGCRGASATVQVKVTTYYAHTQSSTTHTLRVIVTPSE